MSGEGVLVTGAQGFMGSWLAERLLEEGARVIVPRRPVAEGSRFRDRGLERSCQLVSLDFGDLPSLVRVLNECDVGLVFHLAAQTIVATANEAPLGTYDANVRATYNLLEAARLLAAQEKAVGIVAASTYHVYGRQDVDACSEQTPLRPSYPYDVSKACADMVARCYAATYGMPVAVTRLANVYGGGDLNWSRIVPDTARALVRGERPVIASDGTPERDYLYIEDAVEAYMAVARSLDDPRLHGRTWNAGSGQAVSVIDLVRELIGVSGRETEPDVKGAAVARSEIDRQYLDSSSIRDELGWTPGWELERGLLETYRWYEANLDGRPRQPVG